MLLTVPNVKPAASTRRYSKSFELASAMAVTQNITAIANKPANEASEKLSADVRIESGRRFLCNPSDAENSKRNDGVYWRKSVLSLSMRMPKVIEEAIMTTKTHLVAMKRTEPRDIRLKIVTMHSLIGGTLLVTLFSAFFWLGWYTGNRIQQTIACLVPLFLAFGYAFVVFIVTKKNL
jgi:hypothetical protein